MWISPDFTRYNKHPHFSSHGQAKLPIPETLLAFRGRNHRVTVRPDHYNHRSRYCQRLSESTSTNSILRCRNRQKPDFYYQQFRPSCSDHCDAIQSPMSSGTVLQMDKAAPTNQSIRSMKALKLNCVERLGGLLKTYHRLVE